MLIIIENNKVVRKKVCDILKRERMLGVNSVTEALERICKFRTDINLIISRINFLVDIQSKQLIRKVCDRLQLKIPPILGYYTKDETAMKAKLEKSDADLALVEYDDQDEEFPQKFIKLASKLYPGLYYDIEESKMIWQKRAEEEAGLTIAPRAWLAEQGFIEQEESKPKGLDDVIPTIEVLLKQEVSTGEQREDYKQLYFEMKKKYEELAQYVKELIDFIKNI